MTNEGQQPDGAQIEPRNPSGSIFTEEHLEDAERCPTLGPAYFCSREIVERAMDHLTSDGFRPFVEKITKPICDEINERIWDGVRDYLLSDTQYNLQGAIREQVEGTVKALLSGREWAVNRYVMAKDFDGEAIRKTLAALVIDELKDERIADLEAKLAEKEEPIGTLMGAVVYLRHDKRELSWDGSPGVSVDHPYLIGTSIREAALRRLGETD